MADSKKKPKHIKHASDPCNQLEATKFALDHFADAKTIADELNLAPEFILGLAASETGWGQTSRFATEGNNFFSLHAPSVFENGTMPAIDDPKTKVSKFPSFLVGGESFAKKWGKNLKGITDPLEFGRKLIELGFNTGDSKTGGTPHFAEHVATCIKMAKARMSCKVPK